MDDKSDSDPGRAVGIGLGVLAIDLLLYWGASEIASSSVEPPPPPFMYAGTVAGDAPQSASSVLFPPR